MGLSRGANPSRLFVYGTLRRGFVNPYARYLAEHAAWLGAARLAGRLYDLGRYPGLRRSSGPRDWVTGELYRLRETPALLKVLDEYEGRDFQRVVAIARRAGRPSVKTWVYEYRPRVSETRRIVSGDWRLHS
ncbi:MAG TPA: gamma-glutamylcyclotransferase family protein [Bryobacteraceae bacterium]|nr:gamma-glutamylcyclotransferase family protein [Bryobacteraceae bacterium]